MPPSSARWSTRPRRQWVWCAALATEGAWCRDFTWRSDTQYSEQKILSPSVFKHSCFLIMLLLSGLKEYIFIITPVWRSGYWTRRRRPEAVSAWLTSLGGWTPLAQTPSWTWTCRRSRTCSSPSPSCLSTPSLTLSTMPPIKRGKVWRSIWQLSHFPW